MKLDPDFVLEQIAKAPREFDLQARNPERSVHIGGDHMVFSPVYGCPFVRDGLERRDATLDDFQNLARLAQAFPQLDSAGGTICEPNDVPLDSRHLDMVFNLLSLSDKPFMGSVTSGPNAADTIAMAEMVFGARVDRADAVRDLADQRQLAAPLRRPHARGAVRVRAGQPAGDRHAVPAHGRDVAGLGPGALAQQMAEAFAGIALTQLIRPGCPVVFGSFLSNTDMQSGSPSFGTPESAIGLLCTGQIARHFGLPWRSGGGLTSSQTVDAQASYEAMMTMLPTMLAGANYVMHAAGWLESGLVSCFEKFIVDIEILRMLETEFTPLEVSEETLAFSAHEEVGAGGHFLGAVHTLERFRECFYRPLLSSTSNYERWERDGGKDAAARATEIYKRTLEEYVEPALDARAERGAQGLRRPPAHRARRLSRGCRCCSTAPGSMPDLAEREALPERVASSWILRADLRWNQAGTWVARPSRATRWNWIFWLPSWVP